MKLHTHGFMDTTAGEGTLSKHTYFVNGQTRAFTNPLNWTYIIARSQIQMRDIIWKFENSAAWMDRYGGDYDVILVDWHNLAWFLQVETYQSSFVNISSCYVILVQDKYRVIFFGVFWQGLLYLDIHCIRFVSSSI